MDCIDIKKRLELPADRSGQPVSTEDRVSSAHLESCPDCRAAAEGIAAWDREIGRACRDVALPANLKERILAATHAAQAVPAGPHLPLAPTAVTPVPRETRVRRRVVALSLTACLLLLASLLTLGLSLPRTERVAMELVSTATLNPATMSLDLPPANVKPATAAPVSSPLSVMLPSGWWRQVRTAQLTKNVVASVYLFDIRARRGPVAARLVIVPRAAVSNPPALTSFQPGAKVDYAWRQTTTSWVEGDYVYIIAVAAGDDVLRALVPVVRSA